MQSARAKQNQIESEYYIQLFLLCAWDLGLFVVWITSLKTEKVRSLWRKKYNRPQTPIPILNKSDRLILKCPSCQGEIQVPKMRVGQYVSCPTCSKMVLARQELTELSPQEALGMMKENKTTKDER
jgi:DNA-directed RNA polymerase subunit RPC12/RpoP